MSAEVPTAPQEPQRPQFVVTNRGQVVLFALLTLILTAFTVWGARLWLKDSETLTFAAGPAGSESAHFAERLAAVLKNTSSRFRLKIVASPDNAKALSLFDRRLADLALLRTDEKIPPRARALAIVERDPVLLISPGDKKIKSLDDLKKKKIAVLAEGDDNLAFVRNVLETLDLHEAASHVQLATPGATLQKLFSSGYGAVLAGEFLRLGLVDEVVVAVEPVIVARGIPLVTGDGPDLRLELVAVDDQRQPTVRLHYRVIRT